jgi:DNA polymerase kappa
MATYIAKALCPGLIVVHMDWARIGAASESVMDILREYAGDPEGGEGCGMDIAGVDEAYVKCVPASLWEDGSLITANSITGYCRAHEIGPEECVERIRAQIFEETKLTASAGIAPNKACSHVRRFCFILIIPI